MSCLVRQGTQEVGGLHRESLAEKENDSKGDRAENMHLILQNSTRAFVTMSTLPSQKENSSEHASESQKVTLGDSRGAPVPHACT